MNLSDDNILLFAFQSSWALAESVANNLNCELNPLEERNFEGGEHKTRPLISVRNKEVFLINSLYLDPENSVNDKLVKTLLVSGAMKDGGAKKLTLILPYLCYSRKDRRTKQFDPVNTRYIAQMIESVGVDQIITIDVHNLQAYQNAFRINSIHLQATELFADYFVRHHKSDALTVLSPDSGGVKRADHFRKMLQLKMNTEIPLGMSEKFRSKDVVSGQTLSGEVNNRDVIIYDDMVSSGTSLLKAAKLCQEKGARNIYAAATHGLFTPAASETLDNPVLKKIVVGNSVWPLNIQNKLLDSKIKVLDLGPTIGFAINKIIDGEAIESESETILGN